MGRLLEMLAILLLLSAAVAFLCGFRALTREEDRFALYWIAVGALALRGATELLRPRNSA